MSPTAGGRWLVAGSAQYLLGALGGVAVVGGWLAGVTLLQANTTSAAEPSISGPVVMDCRTTGPTTRCGPPDDAGEPPAAEPAGSPSPTAPAIAPLRDGRYEAVGHYETPGGSEAITVSMTLADGVVSTAQMTVEATSPTALQFQRQFATLYTPQIVSRPLSDVAVTRVAGASLTSLGFDAAVMQIRAAAGG